MRRGPAGYAVMRLPTNGRAPDPAAQGFSAQTCAGEKVSVLVTVRSKDDPYFVLKKRNFCVPQLSGGHLWDACTSIVSMRCHYCCVVWTCAAVFFSNTSRVTVAMHGSRLAPLCCEQDPNDANDKGKIIFCLVCRDGAVQPCRPPCLLPVKSACTQRHT